MSKTSMDKKVNNFIKNFNKSLRKDVFGNRFELRQRRKARTSWGMEFYLYELIDNEQPERNKVAQYWESGFSILNMGPLFMAMNNFIVSSDFWEKYREAHKSEPTEKVQKGDLWDIE